MTARPNRRWPFHPALLLGLFPLLALGYAAIDSSGFWRDELSRGQIVGRDLAVFWGAAVLLWRGDVLMLFDSAVFLPALNDVFGQKLAFSPFPYPPNAIFMIWPLGLLPYLAAVPLWLGGTFAFLTAVLRRSQLGWLAIAALLFSPASIVNICSGQNGFLSAAFLCGGLLALERRPLLAGILIGLLSFKPQLGLLLPLLLISGGYWRSFAMAGITVVLLIVGSLPIVGGDGWWLYLTTSMTQQMDFLQHGSGFFQQMSFTYFMNARLLGADLSTAWLIQGVMTTIIAVAATLMFRTRASHELKVATALVAVALVSPYVLTYDLMIINVAILLAGRNGPWSRAAQGIFALVWLLPIMSILPMPPITAGVLTLLFATLWYRVRTTARAA